MCPELDRAGRTGGDTFSLEIGNGGAATLIPERPLTSDFFLRHLLAGDLESAQHLRLPLQGYFPLLHMNFLPMPEMLPSASPPWKI